MTRAPERMLLTSVLAISATVFLLGINWGLPSRKVDPFLFGDHPVWTGREIAALAGDRTGQQELGADVDRNPLARSTEPVVLNATDQQRAEIVRRYRLYTYQPDEMITMMALASMRPSQRDFDPKLYQYGGLWIYPVGGLIKVFANPKADSTYYLDHPEEFGRFYVIARLYTVAWAIIGAWAVFWIVRRLTNQPLLAAAAALCYALMPVVVNMAHEAKPHLPAAVLILLGIIAASKYIDTDKKRWWALAGALVGAAAGMVLSAIPAIVILPMMAWLRREETMNQRLIILLASIVIAIDVYFITNPYVLIHLIGDRTVLLSNLRNSQAMYQSPVSIGGILNAIRLLGLGTAGLIGIVALARVSEIRKHPLLIMLTAASVIILIQFFLLATNKPAEYARFAILPDILMAIIAFVGLGSFKPKVAYPIAAMVLIPTLIAGASYVWHFVDDSTARTTRIIAAERLRKLDPTTIAVAAEPAPYSMPPVDLFRRRLILRGSEADISIRTVDEIGSRTDGEFWTRPRLVTTPISWARKPFEVIFKKASPVSPSP